jgi:GTP-binding protein
LCIVLVDVNVPPQPADRQLLDFLSGIGRPILIVATKSDRLSGNQLRNALQTLAREYPQSHILPFSARTGTGRPELWQEIRQQTSDLGLQASALQDPKLNLQ